MGNLAPTVGDLIAALAKYPPTAPLTIHVDGEWLTDFIVTEDGYGVEVRAWTETSSRMKHSTT